ncbi:ethanolamine kinase [Myxococcota bacterium]|nr:ethanolamine kinase [Myxococcota bacterium]
MTSLPHLPLRLPDAPDDEALLAAARALVPGWEDAQAAEINPVEGGITNLLFRLSAPGRPTALVRRYGHNTELVIQREAENALFARLSALGVAPPLYGLLENGRVEGWLDGHRAMTPAEMATPMQQRGIGRALRRWHELPVEGPPSLWDTLQRWLTTAAELSFEAAEDRARHAALDLQGQLAALPTLRAEVEGAAAELKTPGGQLGRRVVLAHNDLLSGNILIGPDPEALRFIDYEYAAPSYAAVDLANHLNEYAGFEADYDRDFPDEAARRRLVAAYLGPAHGDDEVAELQAFVERLLIPNHLFWGAWSVIQARCSPIQFDFLGYAERRFGGVHWHRRMLG